MNRALPGSGEALGLPSADCQKCDATILHNRRLKPRCPLEAVAIRLTTEVIRETLAQQAQLNAENYAIIETRNLRDFDVKCVGFQPMFGGLEPFQEICAHWRTLG
jgi:hypothetical protein